MIAKVEKPDGSYEDVEMGDPKCGQDFCDSCGDCLDCQYCPCQFWVIYNNNPKNPFIKKDNATQH